MSMPVSRALTSLLLAVALAATAAGGVTAAAKKDKAKARDRDREQATEAAAEPALMASIRGKQYRMAKAKMANTVTRFADEAADQRVADGSPAVGAPAWSDIRAVYVTPMRMPKKLLTKMSLDYPPGVPRTFYGPQADWQKNDRGVFVAVEMADRLPPGSEGQQVEIGLDGRDALPMQVGADLDGRAGVERFSLSGVFSDGVFATGTTDLGGREPGDAVEYYNTDSRVFGYYEPRAATWYLIMPRSQDTSALRVSVRSTTGSGQVVDMLDVPGGGHFVSLDDPTGGWAAKAGVPPLACRSLETFSAASGIALTDPEGTLIRYTAGMDVAADADVVAEALAPAIDAMGTLPVAVAAVGSEDEPLVVDAELSVAPAANAVALTFETPPGQWSFAPLDGVELVTPAGERIFDVTSLTGAAGVRTGPGLDGLVAGDLSCATEGTEASSGAGESTAPGQSDAPDAEDEPDAAAPADAGDEPDPEDAGA